MVDYYKIDTGGHNGCLACEPEIAYDKAEAWMHARHATTAYPEYCTIVYAVEPFQHPTAGRMYRYSPPLAFAPRPGRRPDPPALHPRRRLRGVAAPSRPIGPLPALRGAAVFVSIHEQRKASRRQIHQPGSNPMTRPAASNAAPIRYEVIVVDPVNFYAATPQRPVAGDVLSSHSFRHLAMSAFYAASDVPREDMVVLRRTGAARTTLAHSDDHLRRATPS